MNPERFIIDMILNDEGGWVYTDRPLDRGGPTYAGVTLKTYNRWLVEDLGTRPISEYEFRNMALEGGIVEEDIVEFYKQRFWDFLNLDRLYQSIGAVLLSCGVNIGRVRCAKYFQETLNDLYLAVETPKLNVDGLIGEKTLTRLEISLSFYNASFIQNSFVIDRWIPRYIHIVENVSDQRVHLEGWYNRARKHIAY